MKIVTSNISLESQHSSAESLSVRERLRVWSGDANLAGKHAQSAAVSISDSARTAQSRETEVIDGSSEATQNDPKVQLILYVVEALTGKKVRLLQAEDLQPIESSPAPQVPQQNQSQAPQAPNWGLEYDYHESRHESEQTDFSAQGVIRTADGKELRFELQLQMQREFSQESDVAIRAGAAVRKQDPLVINFNGSAAQLSDTRFAFDINSDGTQKQVSLVTSGSGFLALDANGNGRIDNGTELFGTQSGNGFADLSRHDQDRNGWIDQNDMVYDQLKVWSRDEAGQDHIDTLAQRGVGALYLGNVATPFAINDASNASLGAVRSSGIYLSENGTAGTLQQIDLSV